VTRLRALPTTDVLLVEAQRCGQDEVEHLLAIVAAAGARLWLLVSGEPGARAGSTGDAAAVSQGWAAEQDAWDTERFASYWQLTPRPTTAPVGPDPATEPALRGVRPAHPAAQPGTVGGTGPPLSGAGEPRHIPDADALSFLASCEELLSPTDAAWARACVRAERGAGGHRLARRAPRSRRGTCSRETGSRGTDGRGGDG